MRARELRRSISQEIAKVADATMARTATAEGLELVPIP
jgi:hypothetical protein